MTDDTKNCDEVAEYLETTYPELKDKILVIHTKNNGDINESENYNFICIVVILSFPKISITLIAMIFVPLCS